MSNTIQKHRKTINGVEIVLLEKSVRVEPVVDTSSLYSNIKKYVDTQIGKIEFPTLTQQIVEKGIQSTTQGVVDIPLSAYTLTKDEILGVVSNDPEDGSILSYAGQDNNLVWKQSPNVRFDIIDNILSNYPSNFYSTHVSTDILHIPFAIRYLDNIWGGNGRAGIFFGSPSDPVDNYSIKMGRDDASIGETGYTFGTVYGSPNSNRVVMKFSNGNEGGRGFVWNSEGGEGFSGPVMSLDTNNPIGGGGGTLTVRNNITSELGSLILMGDNDATTNFVLSNFIPENPMFMILGADNSWNDTVLTYTNSEVFESLGYISLKPATAGGSGGGGTFPGVQMDGGSFLQTDQYARIDAGSFV
jgi:hypothetical protein